MELFIIISFIILILIIGFISYALKVALDRISNMEGFILQFDQLVMEASHRLKEVDNSGAFESDDEIGFIFKEIKDIQELLNNIFEKESEIGETDEPQNTEKTKKEK